MVKKIMLCAIVIILCWLIFNVNKLFIVLISLLPYLLQYDNLSPYEKSEWKILCNPKTLFQIFQQILGQIIIEIFYKDTLIKAITYENKVNYKLPFHCDWHVVNGGIDIEDSHSWDIYAQRFAYDFVQIYNNKSFKNDEKVIENYYCFMQRIIAPADGVVVRVSDCVNDNKHVGDNSIDWKTRDFRGNFIIIKHCEGEYSFFAHLVKGSICVKKGDNIKQGDLIGLCGNSGHSTEPHLHFHLQNTSNFWIAIGLPIKFHNITRKEKKEESWRDVISNTYIKKEQIVSN